MQFSTAVILAAFMASSSYAAPLVCSPSGAAGFVPCPDVPVGGPANIPAGADPVIPRFVCGGNGAPCPDKPIGGVINLPIVPRFVCGGNGAPCPDTPIGGPIDLGAIGSPILPRQINPNAAGNPGHIILPRVQSSVRRKLDSRRIPCGATVDGCGDVPIGGPITLPAPVEGVAARRIPCGGANQIACPDTPIGGPITLPLQPVEARRIPCGGANQIACPDTPIGGPINLGASPILPRLATLPVQPTEGVEARRIPCGGANQIACPDTPIGGPIKLGALKTTPVEPTKAVEARFVPIGTSVPAPVVVPGRPAPLAQPILP